MRVGFLYSFLLHMLFVLPQVSSSTQTKIIDFSVMSGFPKSDKIIKSKTKRFQKNISDIAQPAPQKLQNEVLSQNQIIPQNEIAKIIKETLEINPEPTYPFVARIRRVEGKLKIRISLVSDGASKPAKLESLLLVQSSGSQVLDDESLRALSQWQFPALVQLQRVSFVVPIEYGLR